MNVTPDLISRDLLDLALTCQPRRGVVLNDGTVLNERWPTADALEKVYAALSDHACMNGGAYRETELALVVAMRSRRPCAREAQITRERAALALRRAG